MGPSRCTLPRALETFRSARGNPDLRSSYSERIPRAIPARTARFIIMKSFRFAILAIAMILMPIGALADATSDATPSPQMRAAFAAMEQAHAKVEQLHSQARLAALNVLNASQRTLLAQVVGQLAISSNPDVNAAARTIDNSLSQSQGRTIANISSSVETQSRQIMDAAHQQMMAANPQGPMPGPPGMGGPGMGGGWTGMHHEGLMGSHEQSTDPGMLLLLMSLHAIQPPM